MTIQKRPAPNDTSERGAKSRRVSESQPEPSPAPCSERHTKKFEFHQESPQVGFQDDSLSSSSSSSVTKGDHSSGSLLHDDASEEGSSKTQTNPEFHVTRSELGEGLHETEPYYELIQLK